ncbi:MAG: hypothetical protein HYX48_07370 [Chlamydiales bacterium]|nr:hypothetical protein [Chlamydiales bacterium]
MTTLPVRYAKSPVDELVRCSLESKPIVKLYEYTTAHLAELPPALTKQLLALCRRKGETPAESRKQIYSVLTTYYGDLKDVIERIMFAKFGCKVPRRPTQARAAGPAFRQAALKLPVMQRAVQQQSAIPAAPAGRSAGSAAGAAGAGVAKPSAVPKLPAARGAAPQMVPEQRWPVHAAVKSVALGLGLKLSLRPVQIEATGQRALFLPLNGEDGEAATKLRAFINGMVTRKQATVIDEQSIQDKSQMSERIAAHLVRDLAPVHRQPVAVVIISKDRLEAVVKAIQYRILQLDSQENVSSGLGLERKSEGRS